MALNYSGAAKKSNHCERLSVGKSQDEILVLRQHRGCVFLNGQWKNQIGRTGPEVQFVDREP